METFTKDYFNKKDLIEYAKEYEYIVTAHDKMLSDWGYSKNTTHYQFILCKDLRKKESVVKYLNNDDTFNYVNYYPLKETFFKNILQKSYRCTYTIRNDFTIDEEAEEDEE